MDKTRRHAETTTDSILVCDEGAVADIMADSKCVLHIKINYVMAEGSCSCANGRRGRAPTILNFDSRWKLQDFASVTPGIHRIGEGMDGTASLELSLKKKVTSSPSWEFCPISFSVCRSHSASYRLIRNRIV